MALFPRRHPQKDFFVLDIADVVPKDDTASMEHPLFSLATKPDMRELYYENGENSLKIKPSGDGLPTIFDKDILIFCVSQLMHRKNQGKPIGNKVRFSGRELLMATNRTTDGRSYQRLEDAFARLIGTTFTTNIRTGNKIETQIFSMVDRGGFVRTADEKFQLDYCEVVLSEWMMRAIEHNEVLSIHEDYFRIRRPLERRLYEICRKHCGTQKRWQIDLQNLQTKTGSNAPLKKFRLNIRQIIADDDTPFYKLELGENDVLTVRPRHTKKQVTQAISIPSWAEEKARKIATEKGWNYYALEQEWLEFADNPKNAGAAFVGFCKKKEKLR
jgi:plasmid replication initiation protein